MKYRKMGSLDWEVSALGFGAMRLPVDKKLAIIEDEAIKMIRYAIDNGVNYVDTAFTYHMGESEKLLGKALKDGYREKVHLTTKLPTWLVKKPEDFDKLYKTQAKRLDTDPDIYFFHGLGRERFNKVKELNLIKKMEDLIESNIIKHTGFSFHDGIDAFKEIIDYYDWEICQIQHNYLDINYQAGTEGLKYAADKNVAVVIMEPIRGGKLAIPENRLDRKPEIKKVLDKSSVNRSMADLALQFLWNQPEVSVVLSGMSTMQQVVENVESANNSNIGILKEEELQTISELREAYKKQDIVPCTNCGYCQPCPSNVTIPMVLRLLNEVAYWGNSGQARISFFYNRMVKTPRELEKSLARGDEIEGAASLCTQCSECLEKCPQQIDIPDMMQKANAIFKEGKKVSEVF